MPAPQSADLDDFYARLPGAATTHLSHMRALCRAALPEAVEVLADGAPAFEQDGLRLVSLEVHDDHAAMRFPTGFFAGQRTRVEGVGYEADDDSVKLPYALGLPVDVLRALLETQAQDLAEGRTTGW